MWPLNASWKLGVALDPKFIDPKAWATGGNVLDYAITRNQISTDWTLMAFMRDLGLKAGDWPEVDSQWKPNVPFRGDVAATHPHKIV